MLISLFRIPSYSLPYRGITWISLLLAPLVLVTAAIFLFRHRRAGYGVAAIGAALPLPWMFLTESREFGNSWIAMNASDRYAGLYLPYCQFRIVSVIALMTTLVWAATRSLPRAWNLRNRPVSQRTWPAFLTTLMVVSYWFATFAFPYRQPILVDAMRPELSILHVEKDGFVFHETSLSIYRGGLFALRRNDRRLFTYDFEEVYHEGFLTSEASTTLKTVQALPALQKTQSQAPRSMRVHHGEGWYTKMHSFAITAFTTENSTAPPPELVSFFHQIEATPLTGTGMRYRIKDICMGFCYDPKAGLGDRAENERCSQRLDGKWFCY
jgi:hypothetical protein